MRDIAARRIASLGTAAENADVDFHARIYMRWSRCVRRSLGFFFFFFGEQREVWFQKLNVEVWVTTNVDVNFNIINGSFD